jgi:hypothetical protein
VQCSEVVNCKAFAFTSCAARRVHGASSCAPGHSSAGVTGRGVSHTGAGRQGAFDAGYNSSSGSARAFGGIKGVSGVESP